MGCGMWVVLWVILFIAALGGIGATAKRRGSAAWPFVLLGMLGFLVGSLALAILGVPYGGWMGFGVVYLLVFVLTGWGRRVAGTWQCTECGLFQEPTTLVCGCGGRPPAAEVKAGWPVLTVVALILVAMAALVYFWPRLGWPSPLSIKQNRTHVLMSEYREALMDHYSRHGSFPEQLELALPPTSGLYSVARGPRDGWGRPIHYVSIRGSFLMASYGQDGRPDRDDYLDLLRSNEVPTPKNICGDFMADVVVTPMGWHSWCPEG